jgi:high-affinity nickel-transport protein
LVAIASAVPISSFERPSTRSRTISCSRVVSRAYGWAYVKPIRKLYYNLNITLVSVIIAFVVGGIEILSIVANEFGLRGGIWDFVTGVDFGLIGIAIIAVFLGSWGVSTLVYRWKGYDNLATTQVMDGLDTAA